MKLGCLLSRDHRKTGLVDLLRVTNPLSAVNSTTPLDFRASGLSGSGLVLTILAARRVVRTTRRNCRKQGFFTCKRRDARASRQERLRRRSFGGRSAVEQDSAAGGFHKRRSIPPASSAGVRGNHTRRTRAKKVFDIRSVYPYTVILLSREPGSTAWAQPAPPRSATFAGVA